MLLWLLCQRVGAGQQIASINSYYLFDREIQNSSLLSQVYIPFRCWNWGAEPSLSAQPVLAFPKLPLDIFCGHVMIVVFLSMNRACKPTKEDLSRVTFHSKSTMHTGLRLLSVILLIWSL